MNSKFTKAISVVMSAALITTCSAVGAFAQGGDVDYKINSTYANVDWNTYKQYKTDLHSHTTASDGSSTKKETIEKHYDYGFDILAVTDHGTVDYGWDNSSVSKVIKVAMTAKEGKTPIEVLSSQGQTSDGKTYTYDGDSYTE